MQAIRKLVVLFSLGMLGVAAASADTLEQTYLQTCRKDPGVPIPVSIVNPTVGLEYTGKTVELLFVVDSSGAPDAVTIKSAPDEVVAEAVADAVRQWKFKPAERNGVPVSTKVLLPVVIVDGPGRASTYASN